MSEKILVDKYSKNAAFGFGAVLLSSILIQKTYTVYA